MLGFPAWDLQCPRGAGAPGSSCDVSLWTKSETKLDRGFWKARGKWGCLMQVPGSETEEKREVPWHLNQQLAAVGKRG